MYEFSAITKSTFSALRTALLVRCAEIKSQFIILEHVIGRLLVKNSGNVKLLLYDWSIASAFYALRHRPIDSKLV